MSHTVFYRKYRPNAFEQIVGQEAIVATLLQALKESTVSHAYLFCGPRGTGKTTLARLIAKGVNCLQLGVNGEPCNNCSTCTDIKNNAFPDIIEIDAASNRSIDDIRELKDKVQFMPLQGKKKVYIIDEVHMLTKEAFNALLKTLEEPPAHVHFILATTERHKVPATIVSRTQNFSLRPLTESKIITLLTHVTQQEGIEAEENALQMVARVAEGGLRDALTLLEQCVIDKKLTTTLIEQQLGFVRQEILEKFFDLWEGGDVNEKLNYLKQLYEQGIHVDQFVKQAILFARDLLHDAVINHRANKTWYIGCLNALMACEKRLALTPLPILALELAYLDLTHSSDIERNKLPPPNITVKEVATTPKKIEVKPIVTGNNQNWQSMVRSITNPTLRLALLHTEISREGNLMSIHFNSTFELEKVNNNSGVQAIREALKNGFNENLDVSFKVKDDQSQSPEVLKKIQTIFGTQTNPI
ncbi:MAG: DNA polymerase III, subunit gamma and tau [Candidatus Abawacabacteria bacterium RBG_16_42_10]|uniref:DNA polymerase III subunit gamma/tau n=1 Tax=Candidatus Abawacabacteria bacterium RBG_16_42_10 TaxID=1817814 RepID=A0A1F4XLB3_9BACT|nr:MAG: DNA polymerase III, subunit gamma and tau [Candidatus Abawacabacteria bacterium RBG_16_42_10]